MNKKNRSRSHGGYAMNKNPDREITRSDIQRAIDCAGFEVDARLDGWVDAIENVEDTEEVTCL